MQASPFHVTKKTLIINNCYEIKAGYLLRDIDGQIVGPSLGKLLRIDAVPKHFNNAGGLRNIVRDEKTYVFEHASIIIDDLYDNPIFIQVRCKNDTAMAAASSAPSAAASSAPSAAASSAPSAAASSTLSAAAVGGAGGASVPNLLPNYEKLVENLEATRMSDGTFFKVKVFLFSSDPYISVKVVGPAIPNNKTNLPIYKIKLKDLTIEKLDEFPTTTPARLAAIEEVVAPFRSGRRSARRASRRTSRRANKKRGTRRRRN